MTNVGQMNADNNVKHTEVSMLANLKCNNDIDT